MIFFATHFDDNYAAQAGIALSSLCRHSSEIVDATVLFLGKPWPHAGFAKAMEPSKLLGQRYPIDMRELSDASAFDPRLQNIAGTRTWKEFCWSLEPLLVSMMLSEMAEDSILVYLDADSYFFANPIPGIRDAMERGDVALTPHHFPPGQKHRERTVGRFNYGLGIFRNCPRVREVVSDWLNKTLVSCHEGGVNDQTYLDEWPAKLGERLVEMPRGWNVGPWSLDDISIGTGESSIAGAPYVRCPGPTSEMTWLTELVSFHFHEFRRGPGRNPITLAGQIWNRSNYPLHEMLIEHVYRPYEAELEKLL